MLNLIRDCIHLISTEANLEGDHHKCPRVGSIRKSIGNANNDVRKSVDLEPIAGELQSTKIPLLDPVFNAEEHSWTHGEALKSILLPKDVLQWYKKVQEKLRTNLKV